MAMSHALARYAGGGTGEAVQLTFEDLVGGKIAPDEGKTMLEAFAVRTRIDTELELGPRVAALEAGRSASPPKGQLGLDLDAPVRGA
jgi:hypothetical protein